MVVLLVTFIFFSVQGLVQWRLRLIGRKGTGNCVVVDRDAATIHDPLM